MPELQFTLNHYDLRFEKAWEMAEQEAEDVIGSSVDIRVGSGQRVRGNILDEVDFVPITTRAADTPHTDLTSSMWNIFPRPADIGHLQDQWDEAYLREISNPTSEMAQNHAAASMRYKTDRVLAAATGTAYRGTNGTTTQAFLAGQQIATTYTGTGVTPAAGGMRFVKIAKAKQLLDTNLFPKSDRYLALNSKAVLDLIEDIIANHSDVVASAETFNAERLLREGLLGFKYIQTERISVSGSDVASCIAWHKRAIKFAPWQERKTTMSIRNDKSNALQIYSTINMDATRSHDYGVVEILCDQSP